MGWIADLLKEIPSAARYKSELEAMEKKCIALTNEDAVSQSKIQKLEAENVELRQEIQRRDDVVQKEKSHEARLPNVKENLLQLIAKGTTTVEDLAIKTRLGDQTVLFHLEDQTVRDLVDVQNLGFCTSVGLTPAGRTHLATHNLL